MASAHGATSLSGLDYLRAIQDGRIPPPPVAVLLGYVLTAVEMGRAVFEIEPAEYHYNPLGSVHGGVASTVLDSAMTSAIISTLPAGTSCTTLEIKVNFLRPITAQTGLLACVGTVIHAGSRIATAEGRITDSQGKLYAHAVTTCLILAAQRSDGHV
jgi:uncharacterized protein (TIGR00369 family)